MAIWEEKDLHTPYLSYKIIEWSGPSNEIIKTESRCDIKYLNAQSSELRSNLNIPSPVIVASSFEIHVKFFFSMFFEENIILNKRPVISTLMIKDLSSRKLVFDKFKELFSEKVIRCKKRPKENPLKTFDFKN